MIKKALVAAAMAVSVFTGTAYATAAPMWEKINENIYYDTESISMDEEQVASITVKYVYLGAKFIKEYEYDMSCLDKTTDRRIMVRDKGRIIFNPAIGEQGILFLKIVQALKLDKEPDMEHPCTM